MRKLLHIGCGPQTILNTPYAGQDFEEVRLDIDPAVRPDVIGTATNLSQFDDESFDVVFSSHNIEHLHKHEVLGHVQEVHRILKPTGWVNYFCPDLQSAAHLIAEGRLHEPAYQSAVGPITPHDIVYGYKPGDNPWMAHKIGFTADALEDLVMQAGFVSARWLRLRDYFEIRLVAVKDLEALHEARSYLPWGIA